MNDFDREIKDLVQTAFVGAEPVGFEPLSAICKRVDDQEIREDIFLSAVITELRSQQDRLRHRAAMMRLKADEFDNNADAIEHRITTIQGFVESIVENIKDTQHVLAEHAHIEPEVVR